MKSVSKVAHQVTIGLIPNMRNHRCPTLVESASCASVPALPELFFSYSWLYDAIACENTLIGSKWQKELNDKSKHFEKVWLERGTELFKVLFDHTGLGFRRKELTATFSLCPGKPSFSQPLVLNMTEFLDSYMAPQKSRGDDEFVDLVFHELLHLWVVENLEDSQMRIKYHNEVPLVKNHLHLMAIQKFIYTKLERPDLVSMLDAIYTRAEGAYARAWEIIQTEGTELFMNEIPAVVQAER